LKSGEGGDWGVGVGGGSERARERESKRGWVKKG
jgi:hypothetical protein